MRLNQLGIGALFACDVGNGGVGAAAILVGVVLLGFAAGGGFAAGIVVGVLVVQGGERVVVNGLLVAVFPNADAVDLLLRGVFGKGIFACELAMLFERGKLAINVDGGFNGSLKQPLAGDGVVNAHGLAHVVKVDAWEKGVGANALVFRLLGSGWRAGKADGCVHGGLGLGYRGAIRQACRYLRQDGLSLTIRRGELNVGLCAGLRFVFSRRLFRCSPMLAGIARGRFAGRCLPVARLRF